jgi:serine/threonine-protein kinase
VNFRPSSGPTSLPGDADFEVTVAQEPPDVEVGADIVISDEPPKDDRPIETMPTIGHIGRYALKYRLGEGGLGTVYAAFDPLLSRGIALKTLHVEVQSAEREAFEQMLLHEARAAAALSHPNIVTVYDAGLSEEGVYLAMERLHGRDLRHLLADGWRPQVRQAVQIVRRVADALAYAHHKGVVHCDIKPANIFMVSRTSPKVLDFGIARLAHHPDGGSAASGGSPYYMAPEQLRGDPVDRRCDVYALGVVLYELLTGQRAYSGATLEEISEAVRYRTPAPAHEVSRDVPPALSAIVARAMAKDPADRYRSARQIARELRDWLGTHEPQEPRRRRRLLQIAAASAAVLALAWIGWHLWPHEAPVTVAAPAPVAPVPEPAQPVVVPSAAAADVAAAPASPVVAAAPPAPAARRDAKRPPTRDARASAAAAPPTQGLVRLAVSPWGQVEVDGSAAGTTPPLNRLHLSEGRHTIVVRNSDFPPFTATVNVSADQPVTLKHRFGQ